MCEACPDCDDCAAVDALTYVISDLFKLLLDKIDKLTLELNKLQEKHHDLKVHIDMKQMEDAIRGIKGGDND